MRVRRVTWHEATGAGTWVFLDEDNGAIIGAIEIEAKQKGLGNARTYYAFGELIGLAPITGVVTVDVVDDVTARDTWRRHVELSKGR